MIDYVSGAQTKTVVAAADDDNDENVKAGNGRKNVSVVDAGVRTVDTTKLFFLGGPLLAPSLSLNL